MKTVCSANMPYVREAFTELGDVTVLDGRAISADDVRDADLLAIRSTTDVNRSLIEGSSVKFVGTATIGIDHMDTEYLDQAGITWCSSPGCNANSVSEYFTAALLCVAERHNLTIRGKTIGVVGVGNVGSKVVQKAEALGLRILQNDPPRQRDEGGDQFVDLDTILAESDIVTMHVPLANEGEHPTYQMADRSFFERMKDGCLFFNAARGPINNTNDLLAAMESGRVSAAIIDTWEGEPQFRADLLAKSDIATPHIAGHSFEGKVMGTVMVFRAACAFLGKESSWSHEPLLPEPDVPELTLDCSQFADDQQVLRSIVKRVYDIEADDARFRSGDHAFDTLRKNYPIRREFRYTVVRLSNASHELTATVTGLGFQVTST